MGISTRAVAWVLGVFTVALIVVAVLAMTGAIAESIIGGYTGFHVIGVLIAATGVLALVAGLVRRTRV